jgi:hypothetical protein
MVASQVVIVFAIVAVDLTFGFSPSASKINLNPYASIVSSRMKDSRLGHASMTESIKHTARTPVLLETAGNTIAASDSRGVNLNRREFFILGFISPIFLSSLPSYAENTSSTQPVSIFTFSVFAVHCNPSSKNTHPFCACS